MSLRRSLASLTLVAAMALPTLAVAQDFKLGVIDVDAIVAQTDEGKAAKSRFQKWVEPKQKDIDKKQQDLLKKRELLAKQASAMNQETLQKKQEEFQAEVMKLGQEAQKLQMEAQQKELAEIKPLLGRIDAAVAKLAERDGLKLVLDKRGAGIAYLAQGLDYTEEVIRTLNAGGKTAKAPAKK